MIAVDRINAVFALYGLELCLYPFGIVHAVIAVVKNISCDNDDIRVLRVDLLHHVGYVVYTDSVTHVQVSHQHSL